ncbi:putative mRNA-binding protein CTH1 PWA37_003511 [Arxiozyma heterogenica]|uniref:C3H1-type domain-containing protein n=1 Tax=Arxiozyma heterogenica TaxID=278026 RepID=A0AAN7WTJ7_9SACH|nr:hypothetical protein RI543_001980 [Kazachstania heterogenica]
MLSIDFTNLEHKNYHLVTNSSPFTTVAGGSNTKPFLQAVLFDTNIIEPSSLSSLSSSVTKSTATKLATAITSTSTTATTTAYIRDSSTHEMDNSSCITQLINNNNNNNGNSANNFINDDHYASIYNNNIGSAVSNKNTNDDSIEYALKIKEIEDYYLKSLLNEDTNDNDTNDNDNNNSNSNSNNNNLLYSNYYHSSPIINNQNQINLRPNDYQLSYYGIQNHLNGNNNDNSHNNNSIDRRNLLEVDINHSFNHSLPLTTENLQKLSLSNNHINHNYLNYNPNTSSYYIFSNQINNNNSNPQHHNHNNNILSNTFSNNVSYPSQILSQQLQKQQQNIPLYNIPVVMPPPLRQQQQQQQAEINKQLYKTELCESFTTKGFCKYGNKCQFAHGLNELKFKQRSNNFRTKPCINWDKLGYCPYGKRCLFKHGDDRDIQIYVKAGTIIENLDNTNGNNSDATSNLNTANSTTSGTPHVRPRHKNLHANVKRLQKITW